MSWLKVIRKSKKLTQAAVASKAEITQVSYCNIENGKRNPSVKTAQRIAAVLEFEWTDFYKQAV